MSESKTIKRNYYISDFEEEQSFLASYHADGWRLASTKGNRYVFEKCKNETVTYQIDFNPNEQQKDEYVKMFSDFGWQLIAEKDGRFYFSKLTTTHNENELFSDRETKAIMCGKIIRRKLYQLIPISVVTLIITCIMGLLMFRYKTFPFFLTSATALILLGGLILTLYSTKYLSGFYRIKKILNENERGI